jgi:hypothetical protein
MSNQQVLKDIYQKVHNDYKGVWAGERYILGNVHGLTTMIFLSDLTAEQIATLKRVLKC